jgi:hypothetical protein
MNPAFYLVSALHFYYLFLPRRLSITTSAMQVEYEQDQSMPPPRGLKVLPIAGEERSSDEEEEEEEEEADAGDGESSRLLGPASSAIDLDPIGGPRVTKS